MRRGIKKRLTTQKIYMRIFLLAISLLFFNDLAAKDGERFFKTVAQSGDGVYSLLRKYKLLDSPCNLERFYEINKLERNANLAKGKSYFLPILLYEYNRRSIRSTIGIEDWDLAIRIREYNKLMVKEGYRKKNYTDDSQLWVPYHEMYCSEETKSATVENPNLLSFGVFLFLVSNMKKYRF